MLAEQATQRSEHLDAQRRALAFCIERLEEADRKTLAGCYQESSTIKKFTVSQQPSARAATAI